jgi:uncharacterized protein (DUF58 family)
MSGLSPLLNMLRLNGAANLTHATEQIINSPLLDQNHIADLRQRALQLVDRHAGNKAVLQRQHGDNISFRRGVGLDYEESRVYMPGDDTRFMNWRLTARANEPHVKVFREERQPGACLLLDRRSSMRYGTRARLKVTQALRAAVLLAFYHHYCGRAISGVIADETLHWLDVSSSEQGVLGLIEAMNRPCPPQASAMQQVSLVHTLRVMQSTLIRGTQVYLISDFVDAADSHAVLAQLAAEHEVSAIHVIDPSELQLPRAGKLRLTGTNAAQTREVDTTNRHIASHYQTEAQQHFTRCENLLHGAGAIYSRLSTTVDALESDIALL